MRIPRFAFVLIPLLLACKSEREGARDEAKLSALGRPEPAMMPTATDAAQGGVANQSYAVERVVQETDRRRVPPSAPAGSDRAAAGLPTDPAMIIRTGQAVIEVSSLENGVAKLRQLATRVGGFVASSSMQGGNDQQRQRKEKDQQQPQRSRARAP